jgi:transcriptional regulator with XRE-family HTH domain
MCVNRTYISKTESGNNVPTLALLGRFAKGLQVNMSTLLGEDPVIAEIAPYIGHLDDSQRSIILDKVRELAAAK